MLRRLLACLALLTGLAAAGAPAQAEVAAALSSRVVATVRADVGTSQSAAIVARTLPARPAAIEAPEVSDRLGATAAPTVYPGIDRARE